MMLGTLATILSMATIGDLSNYEDQEIEVRGFVYEMDAHKVLAAKPGIRSCCVSKETKLIYLDDTDVEVTSQPQVVSGTLRQSQGTWHLSSVVSEGDASAKTTG